MKFKRSFINLAVVIIVLCLAFTASFTGIAAPDQSETGTFAGSIYTLQIGSDILSVKNSTGAIQYIKLDARPEIVSSRAFLPIRQVIEAFGGTLSWMASEQKVDINVGNNSISLWVGQNNAVKNGEKVMIDPDDPSVMPFIAPPGRVMLPIRFVAESSGATVSWDAKTETIIMDYPQVFVTATPTPSPTPSPTPTPTPLATPTPTPTPEPTPTPVPYFPTPTPDSGTVADFTFNSGVGTYNIAYTKALSVINADIKDGKFIAGQSWDQVWTRDSSYSIDLACGLIKPAASKSTLLGMTEYIPGIGDCWLQDKCGHFDGWPNLTDAIVGATGAWSYYEMTGDKDFLNWSYKVTVNSLKRAERDVYDSNSGLFKGCSSFMESNSAYPGSYAFNGSAVGQTKALSTNMLYYNGYVVASKMGKILGEDTQSFETKAGNLKNAINTRLWMPDKGYYAYYEDKNGVKNTHMEALGESFAILWGVADQDKIDSIMKYLPNTRWGIACQWPQFNEWKAYNSHDTASYYHNGMIWPFVEGYWAWAASDQKYFDIFKSEFDKLRILSEKNDTFMEFYRPEDGYPDGSRRQLWSASGFLSMVYHSLFGMNFEPDGIRFSPVVPDTFNDISLKSVKYRGMTLNITVKGSGTRVDMFILDGTPVAENFVSADLKGLHNIEIRMK